MDIIQIDELPVVESKIVSFYDGFYHPFNTLEEAKKYFMKNENIEVILPNLPVNSSDVLKTIGAEEYQEQEDEIEAWEERIFELINNCNVWTYLVEITPEGVKRRLEGSPNHIIKFMENYTSYFAQEGSEGECLAAEKEELIKKINEAFTLKGSFFN